MNVFIYTLQDFASRFVTRCPGIYLLCAVFLPSPAQANLHHALEVTLSPGEQSITVVDTITRDGISGPLEFELHPDMTPEVLTKACAWRRWRLKHLRIRMLRRL